MHTPQTVLNLLVSLNRSEEQLHALGPRSKKRTDLEKSIRRLRGKIPAPVLSHHDRIRNKGRRSTAPVQDWICHSCYITIPLGLRQPLSQANDLFVCENCGAYIYLPDGSDQRPVDELPQESNRSKKIAAVLAQKTKERSAPVKLKAPAQAACTIDRIAMMRELSEKMKRAETAARA